jgi:dTDP-4-amino-4,6-dideoxygalactose transaminase
MNNISWIPKKDIDINSINTLLIDSIKINQFTNYGPNVILLEKIIKEKLFIEDNKDVIVVSNASVGIQCLASAIEYYDKKKINWATQSFTFPPSAQGLLNDVKIVDIDNDYGLNLDEIDESINGIIVTNIFGNIVDIDKYIEYSQKYNKYLLFDNAATAYTFYKNKNCLNYGIGSIISFHHTKPFGFGEGGAIIVDKKYSNTIRKLINFGIELEENNYFYKYGNNYKMSDISAVYIIQYLNNNLNNILTKHLELLNYFKKKIIELEVNSFKLFPSFNDDDKITLSCFSLIFNKYDDNIRLKLLENNIFCRKYYYPLKNTKNAINLYNNILCLPCTIDLTFDDIDNIFKIILEN